jgi:hypothetical protein
MRDKVPAINHAIDGAASCARGGARDETGFEQAEPTQMPKDNSIAIFVHEQNIERYRKLLQIPLDVQRRQAILALLAQEETAEQEPIRSNERERVLQ